MDLYSHLDRLPDGMPPEEWGPNYWRVLHTLADWLALSEDRVPRDRQAALWLLFNLRRVLPCELCAEHASEFLAEHLPELVVSEDDVAPSLFVWGLHNHANRLLGKPELRHAPRLPRLSEWAQSFWVFAVTQAAMLRGHPERAALFVDLLDGIAPFTVPDRRGAEMLARFAVRHRRALPAAVALAVEGDEGALLQYLEELRLALVAVVGAERR